MEKFISYKKCSKRERKARDAAKRGYWTGINPVARVVLSKKNYKRNPKHKGRISDRAWGFLYIDGKGSSEKPHNIMQDSIRLCIPANISSSHLPIICRFLQ